MFGIYLRYNVDRQIGKQTDARSGTQTSVSPSAGIYIARISLIHLVRVCMHVLVNATRRLVPDNKTPSEDSVLDRSQSLAKR